MSKNTSSRAARSANFLDVIRARSLTTLSNQNDTGRSGSSTGRGSSRPRFHDSVHALLGWIDHPTLGSVTH